MISEHFVATADLLRLFAAIHPDAPWEHAIAVMQALQDKGFDAPKSEDDDFSEDPTEAVEFTQVWRHNNEDGAMAYFARARTGTIAIASLTWTVGVNLSSSQAVEAVKQALADLSQTLGPVHTVLDQTAAWVQDGGAGSVDEMAASACWSRDADTESYSAGNVKEYQAAVRALKSPIGFNAVLEQSASKQWNVIGALSI
jgi:hypothetical protein